jgi:hypothetical protein
MRRLPESKGQAGYVTVIANKFNSEGTKLLCILIPNYNDLPVPVAVRSKA